MEYGLETKCSTLISACLPLLSYDIPRLLTLKLSIDQLKEVLRLPSIKVIGILRLFAVTGREGVSMQGKTAVIIKDFLFSNGKKILFQIFNGLRMPPSSGN